MLTHEEFYNLSWNAQAELIKSETQWEILTEVPCFMKLEPEVRSAVAQLKLDCPNCKNETTLTVSERGVNTGAYRYRDAYCDCGKMQLISSMIGSNVPIHDRGVRLFALQPSEKSQLSLERQQQLINSLRENPTQSLALFGPAGTSKTTFGVALYCARIAKWAFAQSVHSFLKEFRSASNYQDRSKPVPRALKSWQAKCPIFRVSAKNLLEDFVKESLHEEDEHGVRIRPIVNRGIIAKHGSDAALFIEEIDKVKYTDFKAAALFELFDACYEHGAQLVFNTNLTPEKFATQFGEETGPALARRVGEMCTVHNFYEE